MRRRINENQLRVRRLLGGEYRVLRGETRSVARRSAPAVALVRRIVAAAAHYDDT